MNDVGIARTSGPGPSGFPGPRGPGARADLEAVFDRVPALARTPRTVTELPGGLTNRNYKVTTPDGAFVARL